MSNWNDFRRVVGERLETSENEFLRALSEPVLELEYEGPPICGGMYESLHDAFELLEEYAEEEGVEGGAAGYLDEESADPVEDWAMNAHPGLCPEAIVREIRRLFGGC